MHSVARWLVAPGVFFQLRGMRTTGRLLLRAAEPLVLLAYRWRSSR